jgi:hypothetical protein
MNKNLNAQKYFWHKFPSRLMEIYAKNIFGRLGLCYLKSVTSIEILRNSTITLKLAQVTLILV